jgi:flagellar basal body-associated protein FliL
MSLASTDPAFQQKMTDADAALRDAASSALASKTLADLEKPDERNLIRTELLSSFNNILGSDEVSELYLTEFAIQ